MSILTEKFKTKHNSAPFTKINIEDYYPAFVQNIEKAISVCPINENLYIIGGGEIYQQSISFADQLDITRVHHSFDADVYFPEIDPEIWELTSETFHQKDERHLFDYTFQTFVRKK